jgi:8-oxo-dGTP pyrophosphatase MutT (NUDIX family)
MRPEMSLAIPAATAIVFRRNAAQPELLFVERAQTMAFAPGAIVFPGGRVDPGDRMLAQNFPEFELEDAAARIAAIRETVEEAGLAIGLNGALDAIAVNQLRNHLRAGALFADVIAALRIELRPELLVPFSRWRPHVAETRVFDTRFYLAEAPDEAVVATVDETENVQLFWATALNVIENANTGRIKVIFPTRRNLDRLAQFGTFAEARIDADRFPIELIVPWIDDRDGAPHLCIPDSLGYPVCSELLATVQRG